MIRLSRSNFGGRVVDLHDHGLPRICASCGSIYATQQKCTKCGAHALELACTNCKVELADVEILYVSQASKDVVAEHVFPGDECPLCKRVFFWRHWADELDELAARAPPGFRILPEQGFRSARELEVFSFITNSTRNHGDIIRRERGVEIRYGDRSRFFKGGANLFTALDLADYGLDECPTIRVRPGPPYTQAQLVALRVLIAKIELIAVGDKEDDDAARLLLRTVLRWKRDRERRALSIASALLNGSHPGRLVNAYRLLELVLELLLDAEIGRKRRETAVGDRKFVELAATYKADLKTRIRRRVEALPSQPTQVLQGLWDAVRPGKPFDEKGVFDAIANFRNRHVHRPDENDDGNSLPWDAPDFERVASRLMELVVFMLENDPGGVAP